MESRESSSPIITRAVAAGLRRETVDLIQFSSWQKLALKLLGRLPQKAALWLIPRVQAVDALDPDVARNLTTDQLAKARLQDYSGLEGPFPAVTVGVGMGGATAHFALATGGPFLPQAFVLTLKGGSVDGDVQRYFSRSAALAEHLTCQNPDMFSIQHYDPVHDGWLTRSVNHLRLKLTAVPEAYRRFLIEQLQPGGVVYYLEGGAQWLRYRTGERSVFQVGGWGDISPDEFLENSPRLREFARRDALVKTDWRLPGYPLERGPESEWGCEPGFGEDLEVFCQKHGFQFVKIRFDRPTDFSRLAFHSVRRTVEQSGHEPQGTLVETFTQYDATAVLKASLLPIWLIFNTKDSQRYLEQMIQEAPSNRPVFFSPLATFSLTPDMASWEDWELALRGRKWINIGARKSHYPGDKWALVNGMERLREWVQKHPRPITRLLTIEDVRDLVAEITRSG